MKEQGQELEQGSSPPAPQGGLPGSIRLAAAFMSLDVAGLLFLVMGSANKVWKSRYDAPAMFLQLMF